jgi:hypothetical protein
MLSFIKEYVPVQNELINSLEKGENVFVLHNCDCGVSGIIWNFLLDQIKKKDDFLYYYSLLSEWRDGEMRYFLKDNLSNDDFLLLDKHFYKKYKKDVVLDVSVFEEIDFSPKEYFLKMKKSVKAKQNIYTFKKRKGLEEALKEWGDLDPKVFVIEAKEIYSLDELEKLKNKKIRDLYPDLSGIVYTEKRLKEDYGSLY